MLQDLSLTGHERKFDPQELMVSKTNPSGLIVYANDLFINLSGYTEEELLGKPHSIIRHPHMPRAIFKLLWETIKKGNEIFVYIVNRCKNGDHYWVLAHITPTVVGVNRSITGFHSVRRVANENALKVIRPLYKELRDIENSTLDKSSGLEASYQKLITYSEEQSGSYARFVYSL